MIRSSLAGKRFILTLKSWGRLGEVVANLEGEARPVFVQGGIPGERVRVEIVREWRRYIAARTVEVIDASSERVAPPCKYFGPCTGCQWQHISYAFQLKTKKLLVVSALERVGGILNPPVADTVKSDLNYEYRNHARFTVGPKGKLGYVNREDRQFVEIDKCMLMDPQVNRILSGLQNKCQETTQVAVRCGINTNDFLIQPTLTNPEIKFKSGQKHYQETVLDRHFRIGSPSFFQVNIRQLNQLYEIVKRKLNLSGVETIVDAYGGVGTFAVLLAPFVDKIISIEDSPAAVEDALINGASYTNLEFRQGKTEDVLLDLGDRLDSVILDPSRKGCHHAVLDALIKIKPSRIVYVSCDPETLSRDLKILCEGPFHLDEVIPIDMFPQTQHVECVAALSLKRTLTKVILASSSPRRRELLNLLGVDVQVCLPDVDESIQPEETPQEMVVRLAAAKARVVSERLPSELILGADTAVVVDGRVFGKPKSASEASEMLQMLRNREHQVVTGVVLMDGSSQQTFSGLSTSLVFIRNFSDSDKDSYIDSGQGMDKAGGYGIQDKSFNPVERIEGSYTNIVGLPLELVTDLLIRAGYNTSELTPYDGLESENQSA